MTYIQAQRCELTHLVCLGRASGAGAERAEEDCESEKGQAVKDATTGSGLGFVFLGVRAQGVPIDPHGTRTSKQAARTLGF